MSDNLHDMWNKKHHFVEVEIPAVKLLGITIKKAWTKAVIIDCEMGQSCRDRLRNGLTSAMFQENPLFKMCLEQSTKGTDK